MSNSAMSGVTPLPQKAAAVAIEGALLDYFVAVALGLKQVRYNACDADMGEAPYCFFWEREKDFCSGDRWKPSERHEQGSPIIEEEGIGTQVVAATLPIGFKTWSAKRGIFDVDCDDVQYFGRTHLIAAMRCFVGTTLGDILNIPPEVAKEIANAIQHGFRVPGVE